jgi:putative membrane protein
MVMLSAYVNNSQKEDAMKILRFMFLMYVYICGTKLLAQNDSDSTGTYHQQAPASSYMMSANFINQVTSVNMMEVKLCKLAEQISTSGQVKQFATMLENDNTKASKQLNNIADKNNISVNGGIEPDYRKNVDDLSKLIGLSFDKEYIKIIINEQTNDVNKFEQASSMIKDINLKNWIDKTLPEMKNHLKAAQDIQKDLDRM